MKIQTFPTAPGAPAQRAPQPFQEFAPKSQQDLDSKFRDEWLGPALTLAGGVLALGGGLAGHPLVVAGGSLLTAAGSSMVAWKAQSQGSLKTGAAVSLAAGCALSVLGAGLLALPPTPPAPGPLPQLLQQLGLRI